MNHKKYKVWDSLIAEAIKKYSIPKGICLDIACGTGKVSGLLLRRGFRVLGVDKAKKMLDIAHENFPAADFLESDIRNFTIAEQGKAIMAVSFYDSLNYLLRGGDILKMFRAVRKNLAQGAIFLFDINTREHIAVSQKNKPRVFELKKEKAFVIFRFSGENRIWVVDIDLFIKQKGGLYELYRERHIERGYDERDIVPLIKKAGFSLLEVKRENKVYDDGKEHLSRLYFVTKNNQE
jgi:SAM-dependent methyltransferase